jgi:hypothetical protein
MISQCAEIILDQLGGNRFLVMTGAKNLSCDSISLLMTLPRNAKGIKWVRIILDEDDTYTIDFIKLVKRNPQIATKVTGVYAEQLREVFTLHTGLYTLIGEG